MLSKTILVALQLAATEAFVARKVSHSPCSYGTTTSLAITAGDAVATLQASQAGTIDAIAAAIPDLESKPDFSWNAGDGASSLESLSVDARDAAGAANVAWLASVGVEDKLSSLTIFNGPLTDVPHFVSRCAVAGDSLCFTVDFRPRAYGAYEMKREDGSYPGPDELGRQSFEYSGARREFETKFGTEEVSSFLSSATESFTGATPNEDGAESLPEATQLTRGPLYTSVTMPLTDENVALVVAAREKAAQYWLSWATSGGHEHRPGAPINSQYVYDTKFKQNAFGAILTEYTGLFGEDDGKTIAIGESGPLDEAYVGGAS